MWDGRTKGVQVSKHTPTLVLSCTSAIMAERWANSEPMMFPAPAYCALWVYQGIVGRSCIPYSLVQWPPSWWICEHDLYNQLSMRLTPPLLYRQRSIRDSNKRLMGLCTWRKRSYELTESCTVQVLIVRSVASHLESIWTIFHVWRYPSWVQRTMAEGEVYSLVRIPKIDQIAPVR